MADRFQFRAGPEEDGHPLAEGLARRRKLSAVDARALVKNGGVRVNGKVVRDPKTRLELGDKIEGQQRTVPRGFNLVYEDDAVLVVHKGPGVLSVPDRTPTPALPDMLGQLLTEREGTPTRVHPVHRLDRDVSGLLVFARTPAVRDWFRAQFAEGEVDREYLAVIRGRMRAPAGTLESWLDTNAERPRPVAPGQGAHALLQYGTRIQTKTHALLHVHLETGRKNQIRAQLAEAGHPLLGDRKFGGIEELGFDRRRIGLHAWRLRFPHPVTGDEKTFVDPVPKTWERVFPKLRIDD